MTNITEIRPGAQWTPKHVLEVLTKDPVDRFTDIIVIVRSKDNDATETFMSNMRIETACYMRDVLSSRLFNIINGSRLP